MAQARPTISIVTPSLNQARYIQATIASVLEQSYRPLEYLVMDGGSTDGTLEILRRYQGQLRWISRPDCGQADAINNAFALTGGQILGWLNSDDTYAPGTLDAVADFFATHGDVGVVYGQADFIDAAGCTVGPCRHIEPFSRHRLLHYSDFIVQPAAFFRREVFQQAGGLDPSLRWAMDYDFWLKASATVQFQHMPRTLANYRWLGDSKTGSGGQCRLDEVRNVVARYGVDCLPACFRLEEARLRLAGAADCARRGQLHLAGLHLAKAAMACCSPGAVRSLLSPKTWRIIRMGQTLRRRPAACPGHVSGQRAR